MPNRYLFLILLGLLTSIANFLVSNCNLSRSPSGSPDLSRMLDSSRHSAKPGQPETSPSVLSQSLTVTKPPVVVYARVGDYYIESLTGWTSPFAEVNLNASGVRRKTTANQAGFFAFYFVPATRKMGEICLTAQDINQLPTYPVCIPEPNRNQTVNIRDVLLAPSISILKTNTITSQASGMTFPNSKVTIHYFLATDKQAFFYRYVRQIDLRPLLGPLSLLFPKASLAFKLPDLEIASNANGFFAFSLPGNVTHENRVFVTAALSASHLPNSASEIVTAGHNQPTGELDVEQYNSPKSNTLAFANPNWFTAALSWFLDGLGQLSAYLTVGLGGLGVLLTEIIALIFLLWLIIYKLAISQSSDKDNV